MSGNLILSMEIFRQLLIASELSGRIPALASRVVILSCLVGILQPVNAQEYSPYSKLDDPNLKHFYMGRQEIEVFDNTPIVKYRGGGGGDTAGQQSPTGPQGPAPLPAAGFQQYSSNVHGGPLNLPKVENGVPPKAPPPASLKGNAGKLKAKTSTRAGAALSKKPASASHPTVETYKQTYQTRPQSGAPAETGISSSQKVHGKLLPWATTRHRTSY
jgi:hypothetical protein